MLLLNANGAGDNSFRERGETGPMANWSAGEREAQEIAALWSGASEPGGAIVLFDGQGPRLRIAAGLASIEHGVPFTAETTNRLASISKHVCAALVLRAGLDLEAGLGAYVPGLPRAIADVPLGRALDMTGALPDMMEVLWQLGVPFSAGLQAQDILSIAKGLSGINAVPGTEMAYSNTGWRLTQLALESHHRKPYRDLVAELSGSAGATFHFPTDESEIVPGLASGYWRHGAAWTRGRYGMHFSASGGIAASAESLATWAAALMSGRGALAGMLDRLAAPRAFADGSASVYRLGLVASRIGGVDVIGHGGSLTGYRNHMLMAPALGVGVVVLTNREEEALWPALRVLVAAVDERLPQIARGPQGIFAADDGPFWAELTGDAISFMGGYERLIEDGAGGVRSIPAYLDIRLDEVSDAVVGGMIGGVRRRLKRVPDGLALDPALVGEWREPRHGVTYEICGDGTMTWPWAGPIGATTKLTALPGKRAFADLQHGPWRHRPCLSIADDGWLVIASHRSRVLRLERV